MRINQADTVPLIEVLEKEALEQLGLTTPGAPPDRGVVLLVSPREDQMGWSVRWSGGVHHSEHEIVRARRTRTRARNHALARGAPSGEDADQGDDQTNS